MRKHIAHCMHGCRPVSMHVPPETDCNGEYYSIPMVYLGILLISNTILILHTFCCVEPTYYSYIHHMQKHHSGGYTVENIIVMYH